MVMRIPLAILFTAACLAPLKIQSQTPSGDDLVPPLQGGSTKIKEPDKVRVDKNAVTASSAQDAVNAAIEENLKGVKEADVGARMVKFPSGLGFVATGMKIYRTMENPTATRIAQRQAYVAAFLEAKTHLAKMLNGLNNEGKTVVRESLKNINLPKDEMTNISSETAESLRQCVDMMLRGFIIYEVKDDPKQQAVTVSIVTTPKTRGKLARPTPNAVEVDQLRDGINQVLQEVRAGVVAPIGGRIVIMRSTGETAFVGFGSSVVRTSPNAAVQAKLNLNALKVADQHSIDSLCGLIIGDQTTWQGSVVDKLKDQYQEFEELKKDDPLAKDNPAGVKKLEKARQTFVSTQRTEDVFASARKGFIPPGVITRKWFDESHAWAYAISVYVPSSTKAASQAAKEMSEAIILRPNGQPAVTGLDKSGFSDEKNPNVKRPDPKVKGGPSGKVGKDKDL